MDTIQAKVLVHKSGLTQERIARRMRISGGYLSELLHNKKPFPPDLLEAFCRIVDCPDKTVLEQSTNPQ